MPNIAQAIRLALHKGETSLGVQDIFGQDVGPPLGGVFTCTQGLNTTWNTPLDERGIVGMALGLALMGRRPVAEIQFCDYIYNTIDLLKLAGNTLWCSNGQFNVSMVLMTPVGAGIHGSIYHSHSFDAMATHIPGWKIVLPSNPLDAYGLMISAIKDPNPVLFMHPKALIRVNSDHWFKGFMNDEELSQRIDAPIGDRSKWKPSWPELPEFEVPLGIARKVTVGEQLTVLSYGRMLQLCEKAALELKTQENLSVEVIDARSLVPFDFDMLFASVKKTHRLLVVNEDTEVTNFGEHIIRKTLDHCFYELEVAPQLFAGLNTPGIGLAHTLEEVQVPQFQSIKQKMMHMALHEG